MTKVSRFNSKFIFKQEYRLQNNVFLTQTHLSKPTLAMYMFCQPTLINASLSKLDYSLYSWTICSIAQRALSCLDVWSSRMGQDQGQGMAVIEPHYLEFPSNRVLPLSWIFKIKLFSTRFWLFFSNARHKCLSLIFINRFSALYFGKWS